ncbi:MAG: hypothetical protein RBT63_07455 [Bdellovibrionales bacterium]|jgi:hypothetical protein|nr:hypothetical protein [Bdellovibrionales bacterium]
MTKKRLHSHYESFNNHGGALLNVLLAIAISSTIILVALSSAEYVRSETQRARLRSIMTILERNIYERAQQPFAYLNCDSSIGPSSCDVNWSYFASLSTGTAAAPSKSTAFVFRHPVQFAACASGVTGCGIVLRNASLVVSASGPPVLQAELAYEGTDFSVRPITIRANVWKEVLQSDIYQCASGFFQGFDASGRIRCHQPASCSSWTMANGVDDNLNVTGCINLPHSVGAAERLSHIAISVKPPNAYGISSGDGRRPLSWWSGRF